VTGANDVSSDGHTGREELVKRLDPPLNRDSMNRSRHFAREGHAWKARPSLRSRRV